MSFSQQLLNAALKGEMPYGRTRLMQIGLSEEMTGTILKHIKENAAFEKTGQNKLISFNFEKWTSPEAMEAKAALGDAIMLHTRKTIHQTHTGQLPLAFQNPVGRLLLQFKNFTLGSYETQLLSNLQAADARMMASFGINLFFGGLAYAGIVGLKHGHDKEKLAEMLEFNELIKGAFFRSGFATHFPYLMDSIINLTGGTPMFVQGNPTGLHTNLFDVTATPVGSIVDGFFGSVRGLIGAAFREDYQYSQKDYKNVMKLLPLQNSFITTQLHQKVLQTFPESSTVED